MIWSHLLLAVVASPAMQATTRASVDSAGLELPKGSGAGGMSADGRWVTFAYKNVLYAHDRVTGAMEVASQDSAGMSFGIWSGGSLSDDGRYVGFVTPNDLVFGTGIQYPQVYRRDMVSGAVEMISLYPNGSLALSDSAFPVLSGDGSRVAFLSIAGLVPGTWSGGVDVFVRDVPTQTTYQVNVSSSGEPAEVVGIKLFWIPPDISADGRYVVFASNASNLVPGDTNGGPALGAGLDVFLHDLVTRTTERVSVSSAGIEGNDISTGGSVSRDGRFVAFVSNATNLVPNDTNGVSDVFVRDRLNGTTERINVSSAGLETTGLVTWVYIADDVPQVVFGSDAPDLVPGDTNGAMDVFVRDFLAGTTERVSLDWTGQEVFGGGETWPAAISADGTLVTFNSDAPKLVIRDKNQDRDVFVRDRASTCPPMQVYCTAKTSSLGCKPKVTVSGSPSASGQPTLFVVGYQFAPDEPGLFFWGTQSKATPFKGGTLCVQAPLVRTPVQHSGPLGALLKCDRSYSFAFDATYMASKSLPAGTTVYGQYWAHDAVPSGTSLSDGIQFTICP